MSRAVSPVIGLTLLVGLTVAVGTVLGLGVLEAGSSAGAGNRPVAMSATVSAADDELVLRHEAGPPIDVRTIALTVEVDGEPLAHQPPVPFFAATGFASGPTGPFNPSSNPNWTVGERASLRIAGTNHPTIEPGATVVIRVSRGGRPIVRIEARAG